MELIEREELKTRMDQADEFELVMVLGELAFQGKHIPGSINIHDPMDLLGRLDKEDEIVVYCSDKLCPASIMAYHLLADQGYEHVRRYAGGLSDWEEAGYPLEGDLVEN